MAHRAERIRDPEVIAKDARGITVYEPWEVYDANLDGTVNPNGSISPSQAFGVVPFPVYGTANTTYPQALCVDVRVVQIVSNASIIMGATYRSYGLYHGGPRSISEAGGGTRMIELPVWQRYSDGTLIGWQENPGVEYPREVSIRVETRFVVGNNVDLIQTAIARNAGQLFLISGQWYKLSGRSSAVWDGQLFTRVKYAFERDAEIPAIPVGDVGNDVAIPALPALYFYASRPDTTSSANPPQILAVPPRASIGGPPNFPALPGYP